MSEAKKINDGGPAFPIPPSAVIDGNGSIHVVDAADRCSGGMTLRDYFAAHAQQDDRLVKCVRAMDDEALHLLGEQSAFFAKHPESERDEWITETESGLTPLNWQGLSEVQKVYQRLKLEAKAIAAVRYMQADAMLAAREAR